MCEVYTCEICMYTFEGDAAPDCCPDCGRTQVRAATAEEVAEFRKNQRRYDEGEESAFGLNADPSVKAELERVLGIMAPYIKSSPLLDVVWSDKFGYLLISIPQQERIGDSDVIPLDNARVLMESLYENLILDYAEEHNRIEDYDGIAPEERDSVRAWLHTYREQLPEYNDVLEEILDG